LISGSTPRSSYRAIGETYQIQGILSRNDSYNDNFPASNNSIKIAVIESLGKASANLARQ
jgi:hypothetical protein